MAEIPAGAGQVTHLFTGANVPHGGAVVYGIQGAGLTPGQEACEACHVNFGAIVQGQLTSDVTLQTTKLKIGPTEDGPSFEHTQPLAGSGAINTSMAPNTAYLVNKVTALGGRRHRGRMFLPGVFDGAVDDSGIVAGATVTQVQVALDDFLVSMGVFGLSLVILHSPSYVWGLVGGQPRRIYSSATPPEPTPVTALTMTGMVATQRRRLR